jgi:threonine dehydrogenase-like Zn-dependent dehydrogenase
MRALIFDGSLRLVGDHPEPVRRKGESLIHVLVAGICNTDLEIVRGYMGYSGILGHEFVGIVEESDNPKLVGKRVVGEINIACGECDYCVSKMRTHCPSRAVLGILDYPGAMADKCVLPDVNLHIVPDNLPDETAVFCEPLAAAFEIPAQVSIKPDCRAVVLGDGKLGLLVSQVLKVSGAEVLLVGMSPQKLSIAQGWSIDTALAHDMIDGGWDLAVDCTGSTEGLDRALMLVRPRGTIVIKTTVAERFSINLAPVVINEITIVGSRCGPFEPALNALSEGSVHVGELISAAYPFDRALEAFETAAEPDQIKVFLRM